VNGPVRVLVVDDDALVRAGLTMMLRGTDAVQVVGEASDGSEVLGAIDRHHPDVVLLDLRMPRVDGLEAMALVQGQPSPPAILVLTTFDTDDHVLRALRSGASGFLVKDTPPAEIVRAIELVAAGDSMLSPAVTRRLIDLVAREPDAGTPPADAARLLAELSPRELEVARAVGRGLSNADISAELHLSVATVKAHVSRLFEKLEVENRVQVALLVRDGA
jgi:DNA-binding NarL/FixJ family response regulator